MFRSLKNYIASESGAIAVLAGLLLPVLVGMALLATAGSMLLMEKRRMQSQADAAAISAAYELAHGLSQTDAQTAALRMAEDNGYTSGTGNDLQTVFGTDASHNQTVQVNVSQTISMYFFGNIVASATATARVNGGKTYCFLSTDPSASQAVAISGNATIASSTCGIAVNSTSSSGLYMNGNITLNAGDVTLGGSDYSHIGNIHFNYSSLTKSSTPLPDPYADLTIQSYAHCSQSQQNAGPTSYSGNGTRNLSPGVYCGGISVSGNLTINLAAGTYIMDSGGFSGTGNLTISGTGVTIILTNSGGASYGTYGNFGFTGNISTYLKAPTSGSYAGIAVYQDRNAPASASGNVMTGNSSTQLDGVFYAPSRSVSYGGNTGFTNTTCSKIIARKVLFNGNPKIGNDCDGKGTKTISAVGTVSLVE